MCRYRALCPGAPSTMPSGFLSEKSGSRQRETNQSVGGWLWDRFDQAHWCNSIGLKEAELNARVQSSVRKTITNPITIRLKGHEGSQRYRDHSGIIGAITGVRVASV